MQNDPVNLVDPSGLDNDPNQALNEGYDAALALVSGGLCRSLFGDTNPVDLINQYRKDNKIRLTWLYRMEDGQKVPVPSISGQVQKDKTIIFNTQGVFVTLRVPGQLGSSPVFSTPGGHCRGYQVRKYVV